MSVSGESDLTFVNKIIEKLCLDCSPKLARKGHEYLRLLKLKKGSGLVNISDICSVVICLHLAAEEIGAAFDKNNAIKVAGVTKKNYNTLYHTVEKVLECDKPLSIGELGVKLGISSEVCQLANCLIDRYVSKRTEGLAIDRSHPMYACAAVLAACRHKKVRVQRNLLVDQSRIKSKNLDKLAADLMTLVEESDKQPSRKRGHHLIDMVEQMVQDSIKTSINVEEKEEEKDETPQESFAEWKKRMLAKAGNT